MSSSSGFVTRAKNLTGLLGAIRGCASWADIQQRLRDLSEKHKGDVFEELVKAYLLLEPEYGIERRASAATTQALADHRNAMKDAATLAFAEQLAPAVRDIARQVEIHGNLVRTRLAPLVATFMLGAGVGLFAGIGSAVLWMR